MFFRKFFVFLCTNFFIINAFPNRVFKNFSPKIFYDKKQLNYGINIDNYIISHEFINNNLNSTNNLYESYLNVYHKYHSKLLTNYFEKINLLSYHSSSVIRSLGSSALSFAFI